MSKTIKIVEKRPKMKPRGRITKEFVDSQFKPGQSGNPSGRPRGSGTKKISEAYTAYLSQEIPDDDRKKLDLPEGSTWADAISIQTMRRSLGLVNSDNICFTAITELRETTEGKTPDKAEFTGRDGKPLNNAPLVFNIRGKESTDEGQ